VITQKEIRHLASGLYATSPMARDYTVETVREMTAAAKQWRKDVESVAAMLTLAQSRMVSKKKSFDKAAFLKACGVTEGMNK
jgi:hypothetical protein